MFHYRNPAKKEVNFYNSEGDKIYTLNTESAVWCGDVYSVDSLTRFTIGCGDGSVYFVDILDGKISESKWILPGAVVSLQFNSSGSIVLYSIWQRSEIGMLDVKNGSRILQMDTKQSYLPYLSRYSSGERYFMRAEENRYGGGLQTYLLDSNGLRLWYRNFNSSIASDVLVSSNGNYLCIKQRKFISHKGDRVEEKVAELFDSDGNKKWKKGSIIYPVIPIIVLDDGGVIFSDGKRTLFSASVNGDVSLSLRLPAEYVDSRSSNDGNSILIKCNNGSIYLLSLF
ncbi:MAG: hypothetical protein SNJ70_01600 [Armatimonadota bacterium]